MELNINVVNISTASRKICGFQEQFHVIISTKDLQLVKNLPDELLLLKYQAESITEKTAMKKMKPLKIKIVAKEFFSL